MRCVLIRGACTAEITRSARESPEMFDPGGMCMHQRVEPEMRRGRNHTEVVSHDDGQLMKAGIVANGDFQLL